MYTVSSRKIAREFHQQLTVIENPGLQALGLINITFVWGFRRDHKRRSFYPRELTTGPKQDTAELWQIRFAFTGHFIKPPNVIINGIHISIQARRGGL